MKIHTKVVIDMTSGEVLEDDWFYYEGPIASCDPLTAGIMTGGALLGGIMSSNAAEDAANISAGASQSQIEEAKRQFNLVRGDTAPYRDVGQGALYRLADIYGISRTPAPSQVAPGTPGTPSQTTPAYGGIDTTGANIGDIWTGHGWVNPQSWAWTQDELGQTAAEYYKGAPVYRGPIDTPAPVNTPAPANPTTAIPVNPMGSPATPESILASMPGYQFRLDQGIKALERNQSKYRFTPRAAKEMTRYAQGFASNEFGNAVEPLFRLSGLGGNAVNTSASAGANAGNQIGAAYGNMGTVGANAAIAGAAGVNNAIQGALGNYTTLQMYNRLFPGR